MFNNPRIDKLYELMTRLNCVRQTGSTEMLVTFKKIFYPDSTLIVRDNNECHRLKMDYNIDSISINNTDALYGINSPIFIDKDAITLIMTTLFSEIMDLQDKINNFAGECLDLRKENYYKTEEHNNLFIINEPQDLAYIIYTLLLKCS